MQKFAILATLALSPFALAAGESQLPQNARLAIVGDSITEQKLYSKFMETYVVACAGRQDVRVFQFGWSGETAGGFAARLENDLGVFNPTTATLCYGMNDGSYRPFEATIGKRYEDAMRSVVTKLDAIGAKHVVVGTPGAVDTKFFVRPNFGGEGAKLDAATGYNESLAKLGGIGKALATEYRKAFADVHQPMIDAMAKGKAALGEKYDVCGGDGVHPGANGQLIMAYAFLKGLGFDGKIAEIHVDMKGAATASDGHKVLSSGAGKVDLESVRYPFCFDGDEKSSGGTRSITAFLPFNDDLNRFMLKVSNIHGDKAKVTWGAETKEFTKEQLSKGVNLAAEFATTPFDSAFKNYMSAVGKKQGFETGMIKDFVTKFRGFGADVKEQPELGAALDAVKKQLGLRQASLDDAARKGLVPVKHTIEIKE
jgi:lysophospholipase L1-like esterase